MTHLEKAHERLSAGDDEGALTALLEVWRASRSPRVADLVGLVSDRLTQKRGVIKGKTVKARTAIWREVEARRDPADLGLLIAMLWPPRWQAALEFLEPLVRWPDDPRLSMAFARCASDARYATWTSDNFYRPLFERLEELEDVRALEVLRGMLDRESPSGYFDRGVRPLAEQAAAALEKIEQPAEEDVQILEAMEARFQRKLDARQVGQDFEAEIFADPHSDVLRMVYADHLSERGDPRGELIALQMAERPNATNLRRQRALLRKHAARWMGDLKHQVKPGDAIFERGFPAQVTLGRPSGRRLPKSFSSPAWNTVHTLEFQYAYAPFIEELLELPWARRLRGVFGLGPKIAAGLAGGGELPLVRLGFEVGPLDAAEEEALLSGKALPRLEVLAVREATVAFVAQLLEAPVARNLKGLWLYPGYDTQVGGLLQAAQRAPATVEEVRIYRQYTRGVLRPDDWFNVLTRDGDGALSRMTMGYRPRRGSFGLWNMDLEQIPAGAITELRFEKIRRTWSAKERKTLLSACEHLAAPTALPWPARRSGKEAAKPPPPPLRGPGVTLSLIGESVMTPAHLPRLVALMGKAPFGHGYDSYRVNSGTHRKLGPDPLGRLSKWFKPSTRYLEVYLDGFDGSRSFFFEAPDDRYAGDMGQRLNVKTDGFSEPGFVEGFQAVLDGLLSAFDFEHGTVQFADSGGRSDRAPLDGLQDTPSLVNWIDVLGPRHEPYLPLGDLAALARSTDGWAQIRRAGRNVIVQQGESPLVERQEREARVEAFGAGLKQIFRARFAEVVGDDFQRRVEAIIGPAAAALGLLPMDPLEGAMPALRFGRSEGEKKLWIKVTLHGLMTRPTFEVGIHDENEWSSYPVPGGSGRYENHFAAHDAAALEASLKTVAARLPARVAEVEGR